MELSSSKTAGNMCLFVYSNREPRFPCSTPPALREFENVTVYCLRKPELENLIWSGIASAILKTGGHS